MLFRRILRSLSKQNLASQSEFFYDPENFLPAIGMQPNPGKPMYGLYSKTMSQFEGVYSYTFSDFLKQSGLIQVNPSYAPVTITIGKIGQVITGS